MLEEYEDGENEQGLGRFDFIVGRCLSIYQKWVYTDHNEECLFPCEPDEKDEITFLFE